MLGSSRFCSATSSEPTLGVFHELCKCVWGDRLRRHQVLASWSVLVPCNLISPKFPMHKTKFASVMFRFRCVCVCILPVAFPPLSFLSTQVTKVQSRGQCGAVLCVKMHCLLWPWRIDLPCIHLETSGARCILRLLLYTPCPSTKTQTKLQYLIREHVCVCVCACSVCLWVVCWNWTQLVKGVKAKSLAFALSSQVCRQIPSPNSGAGVVPFSQSKTGKVSSCTSMFQHKTKVWPLDSELYHRWMSRVTPLLLL